jgi:cyclohexyl-isocyanide hydratase
MATLHIGFVIFNDITQLDFTGPLEVLSRLPDAHIHLVAKTLDNVMAHGSRLRLMPTITFEDCPQLDIVCVPGGPGHMVAMEDEATLAFLKRIAPRCRYVTSVCTGSIILAAAGLLKGYRATTHWASHHRLAQFGVIPVKERTVIDRNRMTGGGVTAGIDFALILSAKLAGEKHARAVQAQIEYLPDPPYTDIDPPKDAFPANPDIVATMKERLAALDARALARMAADN